MKEELIPFLVKYTPAIVIGKLDEELEDITDEVASQLEVAWMDTVIVADLDTYSLEDIREDCSRVAFGKTKIIIVNLTGSSAKIQNSLASFIESKVLSSIRFILFSESAVSTSLTSICYSYRLSESPVKVSSKTKVLKVLAAASLGERKLLDESVRGWVEEDMRLLREWAYERLSERYLSFEKDEVETLGFSKDFAEALLEALETLRYAESRKVVYSILMASMEK